MVEAPPTPPPKPLEKIDMKWASTWNVGLVVAQFDNSKFMARKKIVWHPPPESWIKLNFNGLAMMGTTVAGGVFCNSMGNMVFSYMDN